MALTTAEMKLVQELLLKATPEQAAQLRRNIEMTRNINARLELKVGDTVTFKPRKTKPPVTGTIKSINQKTCTIVNCSDGGPGWRVPPASLTRVEA